jgi:transcriptional regulator with XRE-family HTH domain
VTDLGSHLRAAREAAGISLAAMAARTHYSKALLGLLETGKRTARPEHVVAYSRTLHVPVDSLYGTPTDPLRVAHEWLVNDSPMLVHSSAGRRVGESLTAEMEGRVVELRLLDDVIGGGDLFPLVRQELVAARRVVDSASYADKIGSRLLTVVAELAQLAGWVASDAGRYAEAQSIYLSGVSAAHSAGDHSLAGQLLSSLSYQTANVGDPGDAALLARSAVKGAGNATPVVKALLLERVAWASARAQDSEGARRALDAVDDSYERRCDSFTEPHWVYWVDRREIDIMAGRCFVELGDPHAAAPLLSDAIAGYQVEHTREVALYQTWLAESYTKAGALDAGRETIAHARKSGESVNSPRLEARINEIEQLLIAAAR